MSLDHMRVKAGEQILLVLVSKILVKCRTKVAISSPVLGYYTTQCKFPRLSQNLMGVYKLFQAWKFKFQYFSRFFSNRMNPGLISSSVTLSNSLPSLPYFLQHHAHMKAFHFFKNRRCALCMHWVPKSVKLLLCNFKRSTWLTVGPFPANILEDWTAGL